MMKKRYIFITILLLIAMSVCAILFIFHKNEIAPSWLPIDDNAESWSGEQDLPKSRMPNNKIAIPGFDSLVFVSDKTEQKVNFYNPKSNNCLFLMTLYVENEELWKSGYVAPGKGYYDIQLKYPLSNGEYKSYLKIQCFKEDGTTLNTANVDFKLTVQED